MMTAEENDLLCRVEGDAPMGQILPRHWIPACLSEEVAEPDGKPVKIRLLGEDQDRNAMKLGDFTGIRGIPNQDIAMWETMGPIADRTKEKLGASDLAVVEFRRLMVDAARQMRDSGSAIGTVEPRIPHAKIRSFEGVVPKSASWQTLDTEAVAGRERVA
ncbi:MAG: hypothetical protein RO009_00100 [Pseudorhodoplanes sp.]|jgi:hypothetical protein|nr:hypothetical protein [Pseudorhodoplanes sp.]